MIKAVVRVLVCVVGGASTGLVYAQSSNPGEVSRPLAVLRDDWRTPGINLGPLRLDLGYHPARLPFAAQGGSWWNQGQLDGPEAGLRLALSSNLSLSAEAGWFGGFGSDDGTRGGLGIDRYQAQLRYGLSSALQFSLGTEFVGYDLQGRGTDFNTLLGQSSLTQWYDVGVGYQLAQNARLSFLWQFSDYSPGGSSVGLPVPGLSSSKDGKSTANLISTQLTIKF